MYREEEEGVVGALVGAGSVGTVGWSQAHQSLTFAFQGHRLVSGLGSSGASLRTSSGEPGFNAGLIKGTVGVPGRVGDPSHRTPHYGSPGQECLQPKRIPQINLQGGQRVTADRQMKKQNEFLLVSWVPSPHRVNPSALRGRWAGRATD